MKDLNFKIIQPWSSFLIYFKLSDDQLSQLIELTDTILEDKNRIDYGSQLAGQIETEVHIDPNYLMLGEVGQYLKSCFELYVNRLWLLSDKISGRICKDLSDVTHANLNVMLHKTIYSVTKDLDEFRFNKAIARIRELSNFHVFRADLFSRME